MKGSKASFLCEKVNRTELPFEKIKNNELTLRTFNKTCRTLGELKKTLEEEVIKQNEFL